VFKNFSGKRIVLKQEFTDVSPDSGKGLGMVSGMLSELGLGEIKEQSTISSKGNFIFSVAIRLVGLHLR
jgi:hypothetical protein